MLQYAPTTRPRVVQQQAETAAAPLPARTPPPVRAPPPVVPHPMMQGPGAGGPPPPPVPFHGTEGSTLPPPPAPRVAPASTAPPTDIGGMASASPPPTLSMPQAPPVGTTPFHGDPGPDIPQRTFGPGPGPGQEDTGITRAPAGTMVSESFGLRPTVGPEMVDGIPLYAPGSRPGQSIGDGQLTLPAALPQKVAESGVPAAPAAPQPPTAVAPPATLAPPPGVPIHGDPGPEIATRSFGPATDAGAGFTSMPGGIISEGFGLTPGGAEQGGRIGDSASSQAILSMLQHMPTGPTDAGGSGTGLPPLPANNGINLSDFGEGSDLRGTQINPTYSPQYDGLAAQEISRARIDPVSPLAGTDLSGATDMLGRQAGEAGNVVNAQAGRAQEMSDMALKAAQGASLGQYAGIGAGTYDPSREANDTRSMAMKSLGLLSDTPDPRDLSAEAFDLIQQRSAPQYEKDLRSLTAREAAMGRQGSGMTDEALRKFALDRQTGLDLTKRELANTAAGQVLANRTSIANTLLGANQAFGGEDRATAGVQQGLRDEARGERGFQQGTDLANANLALQKSGIYSGLGSQAFGQGQDMASLAATRAGIYGQNADAQAGLARTRRADAESDRAYSTGVGQANAGLALQRAGAYQGLDSDRLNREAAMRDELRGERGYQSEQGQQNFTNQMARTSMQDYLAQSQFGRDKSVMDSMLGVGFGSNPTASLLAASQGAQPQGDSGVGDLAALWAYLQQQQKGGAGAAPATGNAPFPTSWAM